MKDDKNILNNPSVNVKMNITKISKHIPRLELDEDFICDYQCDNCTIEGCWK